MMRVAARRVLSVVFALVLVVGVCVLGGASASAEVIHNFEFSFGMPVRPFAEDFSTAAVDQASGDVYVMEYQYGVDRFDSSGKLLGEITGAAVPQGSLGTSGYSSGVAVDNSGGPNNGDLYVAGTENGVVYRFSASGTLLGEITGAGTPAGSFRPTGVAVGATGEVYVEDFANDVVDEFNASGAYIGQLASPEIVEPASIAVDSSGNVYVTNFDRNVVKLESGGGSSVLDANKATAVAVDPATGHVFVNENYYPGPGRIVEFDQAGSRLGSFGEAQVSSNVLGLAVNGVTGEVYAADNNKNLVYVFGPGLVIPDTTTEAASNVQPTSVTLNGTVDPDGLPVSSCEFEYGTGTVYGQSVPCEQSVSSIGSGTSPVAVSANLTGLPQDSIYHFRLVATNANGTNRGEEVTVTTTGPPRIEVQSTTGLTYTTATLEAQIDPFGYDTTYRFEYGPSASYGTSVPVPDADIGSGTSDVSVSQEISGLQSGVTYHYRVVASSSHGTVDGSDETFTTVPPAYIDAEYATNVASTSTTLDANVNPIGTNTEYRLEVGTSVSYGETYTGSTGEVTGDVLVGRHLQELTPSTTYHYRFVAHNVFGTVDGPDHTFTTQVAGGGLALPDGRGWELVSPANKKGALIVLSYQEPGGPGVVQASSTGNGIVYATTGPTLGEGSKGKKIVSQALSVRGPTGWVTQDLTLPHILSENQTALNGIDYFNEYSLFSLDLSSAVVEPAPVGTPSLSPEVPEGERSLYVRNDLNGSFTPLVTPANVPSGTSFGGGANEEEQMYVDAATPDLRHIVFKSPLKLTPEATGDLYEWGEGRLKAIPGSDLLAGQSLGERPYAMGGVERAISADGRRIAWTMGSPYESNGEFRGLYVSDMVEDRTVRVGGSTAKFQSMNSEGSRIFYLENGDFYEYNWGTGTQTDLTAGYGPGEHSAGVLELPLGMSEDGSYVYFMANGVLSQSPNSNGETAVPGHCIQQAFGVQSPPGATCNLYVLHYNGNGWEAPRYIAALSGEDQPTWYKEAFYGLPELSEVSSRVSPDGRFVAFMSERSLTGYDNTDAESGQPDEEVYLYDAQTGKLACTSCNPTGARPVGVFDSPADEPPLLVDGRRAWTTDASDANDHWLAGSIPGWTQAVDSATYQPRYLSDSGRLFFDSPDTLVPQATNGLENVYEYEPAEVGDCTTMSATFNERSGGCVNLISSGTSSAESAFMDASENGDDVFFLTSSRLTAADYDTSYDVYDAHVCSSAVPCVPVPVSPPPCTSGDSCKAAPSPQPEIFGPAPSATFNGVGNVSGSSPGPVVAPKSLTRAQNLARALRTCHKKKNKTKRAVCERQAKKRYGAKQSRRAKATKKGNG